MTQVFYVYYGNALIVVLLTMVYLCSQYWYSMVHPIVIDFNQLLNWSTAILQLCCQNEFCYSCSLHRKLSKHPTSWATPLGWHLGVVAFQDSKATSYQESKSSWAHSLPRYQDKIKISHQTATLDGINSLPEAQSGSKCWSLKSQTSQCCSTLTRPSRYVYVFLLLPSRPQPWVYHHNQVTPTPTKNDHV